MIDARLLPLQRKLMQPPARWLVARGVRADQITLGGCAIGLLAALAAAFQLYPLALAGLALNRLADGLDGAVARLTKPTDRGAFLDIALDFVFYAAFPIGFAFADPAAHALPCAVLIASFVLTGTSFLAFSVIAERRGLRAEDYPTKGIYYLGGLAEGAETIVVLAAFCLFPFAFAWIAWAFAAICLITATTRYMAGWKAFGAT
ncbi:CDP-alcohol phosphatidyltransferase family protein [Gymnodinialimonas ceratoperidinii]|uniref:CDP-alcohol phosphatidyltransferase family protein n=1 Tax=Gymnodinialimonas ceratoperidinii TaxID=2856823 RepID=A0A8F6YBP7_9RHOB|nr:CDP-alcohol phosphatidyltransferase family protein [Gymnodinialimonas ceratoperidinii]QXT40356.1 CDP-alcohol phosphatidyltransferase family protein [Gymnodinialimonas ceratoperidinii]